MLQRSIVSEGKTSLLSASGVAADSVAESAVRLRGLPVWAGRHRWKPSFEGGRVHVSGRDANAAHAGPL